MRDLTISRRYAKALLLIGKENDQAETYRDELDEFTKLLEQNPELEQAIINPLYTASDRKKVLKGVLEKVEISGVLKSFMLLLFDKGRIGFLRSINEFYQKLVDEYKGIARADLISATDLSGDVIDKIRDALSRRTGKEVILNVEKDPSLIGGVVTRIGDLILDGSVKTQLLNMKETIKRGESV